ncbi:metallophosphoesterase [Myxococcaceae bacterium GXIMD 01537]
MHRKTVLAPGLLAALTFACAAQAASLTRAPYLQRVGPDTATVAFRLDSNCQAEVRYGTGGATSSVARSTDTGRAHAVVLSGLTPGAEYTYQVEACGTLAPARRFSTAPPVGTRRVHFAAVGDMGTSGTQQRAVARSVAAAQPELYVTLGDNAYNDGTEAEFQNNFFAPMADLLAEVPMFASPGNHEYVTNQGQPYLDNLYLPTNNPAGSERYYSFDWGHVHFVSIDSNCAIGLASSERCKPADMKAWVEQDLASSQQPWKVVFFHHPPWSSGEHGSQLKVRRDYAPIFEKTGVDLVLTGHDHEYERSKPMKGDAEAPAGTAGIPYLVVGSGGATLRAWAGGQPSWSAVRNNSDYGFLDVVVEEGTLTARMLSPTGKVFDSFTLTKQLAPLPPPQYTLGLSIEGERGTAPHPAVLRATTDLPGATVRWNFGDGEVAEGATATHTYARAGDFTVTATATAGDATLTSTGKVVVATAETGGGTVEPPAPPPTTPGQPEVTPPTAEVLPPVDTASSKGGCNTAPVAALMPVGLLGLGRPLRRRRR